MGFYDTRCMVTGVSLKGSVAACVVLLPTETGYLPLAPAIFGHYDRYGSIDGIGEDAITHAVLDFFRSKHHDGSFVVDRDYLTRSQRDPFADIEALLWCFERNVNDGPIARLDRQPPVSALICGYMFDAIVNAASPSPVLRARAQRLLHTLPRAQELYGRGFAIPEDALLTVMAVDAFVEQHGMSWHPDEDAHQHYDDEMVAYLATARTTFRTEPAMLDALNMYDEQELRYLLEEE